MTLEERILGSLLGGAIGDAMGAATETRTPEPVSYTHLTLPTICSV